MRLAIIAAFAAATLCIAGAASAQTFDFSGLCLDCGTVGEANGVSDVSAGFYRNGRACPDWLHPG